MSIPLSLSASTRPTSLITSSAPSAPSSATLSLLPVTSILNHHVRRLDGQDRSFGTLFGVRNPHNPGQVEIRTAVGHPYSVLESGKVQYDVQNIVEAEGEVGRISKEEVIVGWFSTHPLLNSFSALIHNLYEQRSRSPIVHLTLDPTSLEIKLYSSSLIGTGGRFGTLASEKTDRTFSPLPWQFSQSLLDSSAFSFLSTPTPSTTAPPQSLSILLTRLVQLLDESLAYVSAVATGEKEGDPRVARTLLDVVGQIGAEGEKNAPKQGAADEEWFKGTESRWSDEVEQHKATVLTLSWISSVTLALSEAASRLALTQPPVHA